MSGVCVRAHVGGVVVTTNEEPRTELCFTYEPNLSFMTLICNNSI